MLGAIDSLERLPDAHAVVTVRGSRPVHSMLVRPYRVYYVIEEATVYVIDVVPAARETRLRRYRLE